MTERPTLYLIDGNSYLYRAFYAIRNLSNSEGFPTNALFGFTNMLMKLIREKSPDYFAVVFDTPAPTKRHEAFEGYKAHRRPMPDELKQQVPLIKEMVSAFRIRSIEMPGYEADDILAVLAKRAESEGIDVCIVTGDKDLCQVVSRGIRLYDTMKEKFTEEKDVIEKYGVPPAKFPEIIALMGDSSDNIPGAPGIGEKTAVKLLQEFGSIEELIANYVQIRNAKAQKAVAENIDNIRLSKELATVHTDVPVDVPLDELKMKEPDWDTLKEHFRRFEFSSLTRLIPQPGPSASADTEHITVLDADVLQDVLSSVQDEMAVDTETTSPYPMTASLVGISFCKASEKAYYIPVSHSYLGAPAQLPAEFVTGKLRPVLEDPAVRKFGHNIKYDLIILRNEGIEMRGIAFDTMIASYLLNPNRANHSLENSAMDHLGMKKSSFDDITGKGKKNFSEVEIEAASEYAAGDAAVTLMLKQRLGPKLTEQGLSDLFHEIEMPLVEVLADMEMAGVRIDLPLMGAFSRQLEGEISSIEKRIYFLAGEEFNINSPKQLQEILFEKLGLRTIKKTKTGFSTDIEVLEQLALEHELPKEIIEHRMLSKLKGTYVDALPRLVNAATGRLHTSFNQTITATGRLSSSDPNLQNIPVRGAWGKKIREAFIADAGALLISSDYSQIELRVLAHLSGDEKLISIFRQDGDIHTGTACELFGVSPEGVTAEMRRSAKSVNFGIIYGISPYGLSQQLGISPEEARSYIDIYFSRHAGVRKYIDELIQRAAEDGHVTTLYGRKRAIPELKSANRNTRQLGERLAMNTPIQGTAADIIKICMLNMHRRLRKEGLRARMLLQVHDELLFEVPEEEKETVKVIVREEMENAVALRVPLKVDMGIGKNWAEAH